MNNPVSRIEMLDRWIERWAAMIFDCLVITLAGILLSAQNVFHAVLDWMRHGPQAGLRRQLKAPLAQAMMATSVSSLYAVARKPPHEMAGATEMDLRGKTRSQTMTRLSAIKTAKSDAWAAAPIAVTNIDPVETGFAQDLRNVSARNRTVHRKLHPPVLSLAVSNRPQASICQGPGRG